MRSFVLLALVLVSVAAFTKPLQQAIMLECVMCEQAVLHLEQLMEDGEPDLQKAMTSWCHDLGSALGKACTAMIDQYIDNMIDGVVNKHGPGVICVDIKMCNAW